MNGENYHFQSWNTSLPIIVSPTDSCFNIAKLMANEKNNCALVEDNIRNKIIGIFTAKDLVFKVVSQGKHPKLLKAKDIMTPNPIFAKINESASSALNKMIKYRIRHLPLFDLDGYCMGLLDITKCFNETINRVRKLNESSQKLNEALMEVQENIAHIKSENLMQKNSEMYYQAQDMVLKAKTNISNLYQNNLALTEDDDFEDFETLLELMESPTLDDILSLPNHTPTVFVDSNHTIKDAADLMKKNNTTAVLVRDTTSSAKSVIGILTTKDIVYRVIAKEEEPQFTIVSRIMTPNPEFGEASMGVVEAFELMFSGNFLNLPVTDDVHNVIGIVSVLQLTTMALLQLHKGMSLGGYEENYNIDGGSNPKWDKFWGCMEMGSMDGDLLDIAYNNHNTQTRSTFSAPIRSPTKSTISIHKSSLKKKSLSNIPKFRSSSISKSGNTLRTPPIPHNNGTFHDDGFYGYNDAFDDVGSDILPEDSISCYLVSEVNSVISESQKNSFKAQRQSFLFKLKDLDDNTRRVHKFRVMIPKSKNVLTHLKDAIEERLQIDMKTKDLSYVDEDNDMISIVTEDDLKAAMEGVNLMSEKKTGLTIFLQLKSRSIKLNSTKSLGLLEMLQKPEIMISSALCIVSVGIFLGLTLGKKK